MNPWCETCGGFRSLSSLHVCPSKWKVWRPEDSETEEDAVTVRAWRAEAAAETWADEHNRNGEYEIMDGNEATVMVRPEDDSLEAVRLVVTGEMVPNYTAREAK